MIEQVREQIERTRRAVLHRQIAGIDAKLRKMAPPYGAARRVAYFRLLTRKRQLERKLTQSELFVSL